MALTVKSKSYRNSGNNEILNMVPVSASHILDIGCGAGDNAKHLHSNGRKVDGITLSEIEADQAKEFCENVYLYDLETGLPTEVFKKKYDVCICSHVLEHICWPEKLLLDVKKVLNPDGVLLVALPNLMHYKPRIELMKGNFNYAASGIWDNTHFRWYTFSTGKLLLETNGFEVLEAKVSETLPFKRHLQKILSNRLQQVLNSILVKVSPGLFGSQLLYKAKI